MEVDMFVHSEETTSVLYQIGMLSEISSYYLYVCFVFQQPAPATGLASTEAKAGYSGHFRLQPTASSGAGVWSG